MPTTRDNPLGAFLKDRRAKLDPAAFGFGAGRRRTPGLRREEVSQRAGISATWYTWLEQGRGGAPSADALERIAHALTLTPAEREHLFLLARGQPPQARYHGSEGVSPRLQRVLDALETSPALVKTSVWDIVAWNRAATAVLADYAAIAPERRNILRLLFCDPHVRGKMPNWESDVRAVVASFRLETARAGAHQQAAALVDELSAQSPEFAAVWRDNDVRTHGEGTKLVVHPVVGPLALEFSTFGVDDRPDLGLVIYTPATDQDVARVRTLLAR